MREDTLACGALENKYGVSLSAFSIFKWDDTAAAWGKTGSGVLQDGLVEWRLAPASDHRIPEVSDDKVVIIVCDEGYASSLAAATLQELGLPRATDLIGGFQAWRLSGLPITK